MEIRQGYSYHIKDEFFCLVDDKYLMSNKEQGNYRPHYYAIQDKKNPKLYWMIPISSQAEKYKEIIEKKKKRYGRCNTIVIGLFAGKENAFLIQNAFPVIEKYLTIFIQFKNSRLLYIKSWINYLLKICIKCWLCVIVELN